MSNIPGTNIPDIPVTDWEDHLSTDITAFLAAEEGEDVRGKFVDMANVIANVILKQAVYTDPDLDDTDPNAAARAAAVGLRALLTRAGMTGYNSTSDTPPSNLDEMSDVDDCDDLTIGSYWKNGSEYVKHGVNNHIANIVCFTPGSRAYAKCQLWFDCGDNPGVYYRTKGISTASWTDWALVSTLNKNNTFISRGLLNGEDTSTTPTTPADDCNNLTIGSYYKDNNVEVENGYNTSPALIVSFRSSDFAYGKVQMWYDLAANEIVFRTKRSTNSEWTDWTKIINSADSMWGDIFMGRGMLHGATEQTEADDCDDITIGSYFKDGGYEIEHGYNTSSALIVCFRPERFPWGKVQLWFDLKTNEVLYRIKRASTTPWTAWLSITNNAAQAQSITDGLILRLEDEPDPIPVGENRISYSDFIDLWDDLKDEINALVSKEYPSGQTNNFADIVTKETIGHSSFTEQNPSTYAIFKYEFIPRDYTMTVVLSAGCDGDEYEGFWSLYRFMRALYFEGYKYPNLRKLRHQVRFVVIPVWNPWGMENGVRNCPLGFQTLDNLNQSVTVGSTTYPPFTSLECQAIRDCLDELQADNAHVNLWIDIHTDPYSYIHGRKKGFYGYAPTGSAINKVLYGLAQDFDNLIYDETGSETNFTIYNSGASANAGMPGYGVGRGIPTSIVEVTVGEFQASASDPTVKIASGSAQMMRYAQEWYWNVIAYMISVV